MLRKARKLARRVRADDLYKRKVEQRFMNVKRVKFSSLKKQTSRRMLEAELWASKATIRYFERQLASDKDEIQRLKSEIDELTGQLHRVKPAARCKPILEDTETDNFQSCENFDPMDDLMPKTPPKSHPRQSIGQWSQERKKNNLSVSSLIKSLETQTGSRPGRGLNNSGRSAGFQANPRRI